MAQRFALARAFDVGQLDHHAVGVAAHGELDAAFLHVAEDDATRDAVAARRDQRVEQRLGWDDRGCVVGRPTRQRV